MEIEGPYGAVRRRVGVLAGRRLAVPVPAHPRELDRGRHDRHPAGTSSPSGCSACPSCGNGGTDVNFDLTDEQQMLQAAAREFLAARLKSEQIRELAESDDAFSEDLWREMSELNWPGLMVSETVRRPGARHGRAGGADGAARLRARSRARSSRACWPRSRSRPRPPTSRRSATWRRSRPASSAARWRCGTPAPAGRPTTSRSSPSAANGGYVLRGEKLFVLDAATARLLHRGRDRRPAVHRRARRGRASRSPRRETIDATRKQYAVKLDGVKVGEDAAFGGAGRDGRLRACAPTPRSRPS